MSWAQTRSRITWWRCLRPPYRAVDFGIQPSAVFGFWDWVGGRYSLSSPVGLSIELAIGVDQMREFRSGMHEVDQELVSRPLRSNAALMLGMLDVWYTSFGTTRKAVVPYAQDLDLLPAICNSCRWRATESPSQPPAIPSHGRLLQSSGGHLARTASTPSSSCCTREHRWFLSTSSGRHKGTETEPAVQANLVAQPPPSPWATAEDRRVVGVQQRLIPHRTMPGNRPSSLLRVPDISPRYIGAHRHLRAQHRGGRTRGESTPSTSGAWSSASSAPAPCSLPWPAADAGRHRPVHARDY